jgi:hypothetical protein
MKVCVGVWPTGVCAAGARAGTLLLLLPACVSFWSLMQPSQCAGVLVLPARCGCQPGSARLHMGYTTAAESCLGLARDPARKITVC